MIGASARSTGSKWPLFGVLAVLCGVVYIAAGMLHQQALDTKIRETEDRVQSFASQVVAPVLQGVDLTTSLEGRVVARLHTAITSEMTDPQVARMRVYARTGMLLFSTDDGDRIGTKKVGDPALITAALSGATRSDTDADEVAASDASGSVSAALVQAYAPIAQGSTTDAPAVLQVDHRYPPIAEATARPWTAIQTAGLGGAGLFLLLCFASLVQWVAAKRQSARSGFVSGASRGVAHSRATKKLEAEVERLRRQLEAQERGAAEDSANFQEQLRAAVARSEQASARPPDHEAARDAEQQAEQARTWLVLAEQRAEAAEARERATEERVARAETDAAEAKASAVEAKASAVEAEARAAALAAETVPSPTPDEDVTAATAELEAQLSAARAEAGRLEQQVVELEHRMLDSDQEVLAATQRAEVADAAAAQQEALVARAGEAERMVSEAERRATHAEEATAKAEARASEAAARVTALEQQAQDAELRAAEALAEAASSSAAIAAEADQARAHVEELTNELERARAAAALAETHASEVQTRVRDAEALAAERAAELEAEVTASVQRAETAEARLSGTTELSAENARLKAEVQAEQQRGRMAMTRAEEAEARLTQLEGHASTLAQSLEDERVRRQASAADADRALRDLAEAKEQVAELEAGVAEAGRVAATQERRAAELLGELDDTRAEAATAAGRLAELEPVAARLSTVEGELADVRRTSEHAEKAWIDRVQGLENELAAARSEVTATRTETDAERERVRAELEELDALRTRVDRSEAALIEQTSRASRADAHAEQAEMRVRELSAGIEMERTMLRDRLDQEMEQMRTSIAEAEAAASETRGEAEFKVRQLEEAMAQSASRAEDAERRVIAATERAEEAERRAAENAFTLQAAKQRARDTLERADGPKGGTPASGEDAKRALDLQRALGEAQRELEQTRVRARRAYADAENARAQLQSARDRGDLPSAAADPAELGRVRAELAATIERAKSAEDLAAMLQADLLAAHRGVDPDGASEVADGEDGSRLRSRLARAADRKRGRSHDGWS